MKEGGHRQVGYAEDFKRFIEAHKDEHLLKRFKDLEKRLEGEPVGTVVEDGELSVTRTKDWGDETYVLFNVRFGDESFFVKRETEESEAIHGVDGHTSINEIKASELARNIVEKLPRVTVIDFQFAFKDEEHDYFVSKWNDLPTLSKYLSGYFKKTQWEGDVEARRRQLERRMDEISTLLNVALSPEEREKGIFLDVRSNAFYDENTDTIILFDLHRGKMKL